MNFICSICADLILPSEDIYANSCGHIFHYLCLKQWLDRSKTCPQCRKFCSDNAIHKIYLTVSTSEFTGLDIVNLEKKLDNIQESLLQKNRNLESAELELKSLKLDKRKSAKMIISLEEKVMKYEVLIKNYISQLKILKNESQRAEHLNKELTIAKEKIQQMKTIELFINSSLPEVEDLLNKHNDPKIFAILVANLKRELTVSGLRKDELRTNLNILKNDIKKEHNLKESLFEKIRQLESDNFALKREMTEKLNEFVEPETISEQNFNLGKPDNIRRLKRKLDLKESCLKKKPERSALKSTSPYLRIQSSIVGLKPLLKSKKEISIKPELQNFSIFKKNAKKIDKSKYEYNGLGGIDKNENFPGFPEKKKIVTLSTSVKARLRQGKLKNVSY